MKTALFIALLSTLSFGASAKSFNCSNAQQKKWTEYYCLSAEFSDANKLENVNFGKCEGSVDAEEEEPVAVYELGTISYDKSLSASSAEWKNAYSYNVSTELGQAALYIKAEAFNSTEAGSVVRIKINEEGKAKDVRLACSAFN